MIEYVKGASLPEPDITWKNSANNTINFSTGWTFSAKAGIPNRAADLTKTSGITGAATAPNISIDWTSTELDALNPGAYVLEIIGLHGSSGQRRKMQTWLVVKAAVT